MCGGSVNRNECHSWSSVHGSSYSRIYRRSELKCFLLCVVQWFYSKRWCFIYFLLYVFECKTILHQAKPRELLNRFALYLPAIFNFDLDCTVVTTSVHNYLIRCCECILTGCYTAQALCCRAANRGGMGSVPAKVRMRFMVGKVVLGQDFLRILWFSFVSTMPPMVYTHSCILYWCCVILIIDSVVKQQKKNFLRLIP